jgi:NAD(P)H-dependent FMN reductase
VLKNAWNRKAAAFVSYGSAMGARSVQQLRQTAIELQLAPIRSSVHIPVATLWAHYRGGDVDAGLAELEAHCRDADRRSAVVDRSLEDGARRCVLIATAP